MDEDSKPTGEQFEIVQGIKEDALTEEPETGRACRRAIPIPIIRHSGPAWDWCEATRKYINECRPKYIRDDKNKIRRRFPKGGV